MQGNSISFQKKNSHLLDNLLLTHCKFIVVKTTSFALFTNTVVYYSR